MNACSPLRLISSARSAAVRSGPRGAAVVLSLQICLAPTVLAADEAGSERNWLDAAQYHGFVSQGYIKTDHNNFFGDSESGSFDFTELGANVSLNPSSNLRISAQLNYRRAGDNAAEEIGLDFGFVDYRLLDSLDNSLGLRLGRIKNPYGFYNETRDVAATRPSVLLPQSVYSDPLRDVWHSADSIGGYWYAVRNNLEIKFDGIYGRSDVIGETVGRVRLPGYRADLDNRYVSLGRASLGSDTGSWKIAYTFGKTALDFSAREPVQLQGGEIREAINLLSAEYLLEQWILTAEYQQVETWSRADGVPAVLDTSESWYAQAVWLFQPKWRALLRYDHYMPSRDLDEVKTGDLTAGLRYDYDNHWMLAVEYHRVRGTDWLTPVDNPDPGALVRDWDMLAAVVSYRF